MHTPVYNKYKHKMPPKSRRMNISNVLLNPMTDLL